MSIETYVERFSRLNVGRVGGHERPHKPVMILAVLDLFDQGILKSNEITLSPDLLELFHEYFKAVASGADKATPINPFFYLRGDGFWHHHPRPGQESLLPALKNPPGILAFQEISDYAYLDEDLFALLHDASARTILRQTLITRYFADKCDAVVRVAAREAEISRYQEKLEEGARVKESVDEVVRSTAFSRLVRRAYDYRCAACGLRVTWKAASTSSMPPISCLSAKPAMTIPGTEWRFAKTTTGPWIEALLLQVSMQSGSCLKPLTIGSKVNAT